MDSSNEEWREKWKEKANELLIMSLKVNTKTKKQLLNYGVFAHIFYSFYNIQELHRFVMFVLDYLQSEGVLGERL